ncbi:hypothetical protein ACFPZL_05565 [Leucobacter soli]|uniref:AbiEi antitoxin C-terminal domain-containing protein n=1 Tax=Leucobacter soli TaxID=2812850 RepID=A0A916JT18_9MICO|nr:hypothetical protein [Leucobacter soli]CAG7595955.1 hypothetical protein LEUCIP111803_00065 [Leucobacter soli]
MPAARVATAPPARVKDPPNPPRYDLWPAALRSAGRLHGLLVPCGPGFRGIGWPETPRVRTAALAEFLSPDLAATHLTAAWVWGAAKDPGEPLRFSTRDRRRNLRRETPQIRISELRLAPGDMHELGAFAVTTPLRTLLDLLYADTGFGKRERVACRLLALQIPGGWATARERVEARRRPYRTVARERLAALAPDRSRAGEASPRSSA